MNALRVYLVDDEPLAVARLRRMLAESNVEIAGSTSDPEAAVEFLSRESVDALFLDIQMPGLNGFELLAKLPEQPLVIFTTAYDQYALRAFEVNSIDFLLKPVDPEHLQRALRKLESLRGGRKPAWMEQPQLQVLLEQLTGALKQPSEGYKDRITSKVGDRVSVLNLDDVTHFFARDKLTYAVVDGRSHPVEYSIADLERRLDPRKFIRIHRATLLNAAWVGEVNSRFAGRVTVSLKDPASTRLEVSRDRVRPLREFLG